MGIQEDRAASANLGMTARDNLNWAVDRALEFYDQGNTPAAIASFLSDVQKHVGTAWIATHPMTFMILNGANGREEFEKAMSGFAVSG